MRTIIALIVLLAGSNLTMAQRLNAPLLISGRVFDSAGNQIPQDDLRLRVFLETEPVYSLTEQSPSCGYHPPLWFAELGNLNTDWHYGDDLVILIEYSRQYEKIRFIWIIDSTAQVPLLQTQKIGGAGLISNFRLSDRGVMNGRPVVFQFETAFDELNRVNLKIMSRDGLEIYNSALPEQAGENVYQFTWDGRSTDARPLRSGIYFYFLISGGETIHSGIVTLKNE